MTLEQIFSDNYSYLHKIAIRIAGRNAEDLLTETYLTVHEKKKGVPTKKNEFIKFFVKWMSNCHRWSQSSYNKQKTGKELLVTEYEYTPVQESEPCKECLFNEIELFKRTLPSHEKALFELHFEDKVSCRMIAQQLSFEFKYVVNPRSIERMVLPIKKKIKDKKWNME